MRCIENGRLNFTGKTEVCWNCSPKSYKPVPTNDCSICNGSKSLVMNRCSSVTEDDRKTLCDMIDFATPYEGKASGFNEGYLGIGILAGITDYGRYMKMTEADFQAEVKGHVMKYHLQYAGLTNKAGDLPKKFTVRRGQSGWFVYPVF